MAAAESDPDGDDVDEAGKLPSPTSSTSRPPALWLDAGALAKGEAVLVLKRERNPSEPDMEPVANTVTVCVVVAIEAEDAAFLSPEDEVVLLASTAAATVLDC